MHVVIVFTVNKHTYYADIQTLLLCKCYIFLSNKNSDSRLHLEFSLRIHFIILVVHHKIIKLLKHECMLLAWGLGDFCFGKHGKGGAINFDPYLASLGSLAE